MDIKLFGLNATNKLNLNNNIQKNKLINFSGSDIVDFTEATKARRQTLKELNEVGYTNDEANELIAKYSKTEEFKKLIEGYNDEFGFMSEHNVEAILDRNLSQAEAIVYLEYNMDDYYMQHGDIDCQPAGYEKSTYAASDYEIGTSDFLPLDLAKQIKKGFDIEVAGMILKGKITEEEAKKMQPFYDETTSDNYSQNYNVQQAEFTIARIIENLDNAQLWTSEEKDEKGNLVSGFTRPLTNYEATALMTNEDMPRDKEIINRYIAVNEHFGSSIYDMTIFDLWGKTVEDIQNERAEAARKREERELNKPQKPKIETVNDLIDVLRYKVQTLESEEYNVFFEEFSKLDSEKFLHKLTFKQIKFDAISSITHPREQIQENIKALNTMSKELIDKITRNDDGEEGRFPTLSPLLNARGLEEKIKYMEEYRINSPQLFNRMSKESVLDYLTDSTFFSETKKSYDEFQTMLESMIYGLPFPEENKNQGKVLEFPKKDEE